MCARTAISGTPHVGRLCMCAPRMAAPHAGTLYVGVPPKRLPE